MSSITVIKRDHHGTPVWRYEGEVALRGDTWVCLTARFNRDDLDAGYMVYKRGDLFTEWFYGDRWYNVFRIEDVGDGSLKGWYCNVTRPALIGETTVEADDLALDVYISPAGEILLLDEDEFAALDLTPQERAAAWSAVEAIRALAQSGQPPFAPPATSRP